MADHYHGTFWVFPDPGEDPSDSVFLRLDTGLTDLEAVFVTNSLATAEYFSGRSKGKYDVQVVLKGTLRESDLLVLSAEALQSNPWIEIDEREYHVANDREELFEALRRSHGGISITGNYEGGGDDTAIFDGDMFEADAARLLIDGEWTDWLPLSEAAETFERFVGASIIPPRVPK